MLRVEEGFQGNGLAQSYRHEARKPCLYLLRKHEQQQMIMIIIIVFEKVFVLTPGTVKRTNIPIRVPNNPINTSKNSAPSANCANSAE